MRSPDVGGGVVFGIGLDPWRAILDLHDHLDGDATYRATVVGRRTDTRTAGEWTGPIVEYAIFKQRGNPALQDGAESRKLVRETVQLPSVRYRLADPDRCVY